MFIIVVFVDGLDFRFDRGAEVFKLDLDVTWFGLAFLKGLLGLAVEVVLAVLHWDVDYWLEFNASTLTFIQW